MCSVLCKTVDQTLINSRANERGVVLVQAGHFDVAAEYFGVGATRRTGHVPNVAQSSEETSS
jgi:hypothetical protein